MFRLNIAFLPIIIIDKLVAREISYISSTLISVLLRSRRLYAIVNTRFNNSIN